MRETLKNHQAELKRWLVCAVPRLAAEEKNGYEKAYVVSMVQLT
jgi:hypothetical protein